MERTWLFFADLILVAHMVVVLFILGGFVLTWIGYFRKWSFVRNFYFRIAHLFAIGFVAIQTLLGEDCPLTVWENQLRVKGGMAPGYHETFIGHWLGKILFFELGLETFAIIYAIFFGLVILTFFVVRPRWPRKSR